MEENNREKLKKDLEDTTLDLAKISEQRAVLENTLSQLNTKMVQLHGIQSYLRQQLADERINEVKAKVKQKDKSTPEVSIEEVIS